MCTNLHGVRGREKRQKMCFYGSHVFASLDKKPAGIQWRRGCVNQWSLLLPRIGKDNKALCQYRGGVFGTPHPPFRIQAPQASSCTLGEPSGSQGLCMASCCQPPSYPIPGCLLSSLELLAHGHSGFVVLFFLALLQLCSVTPESKA